MPAAEGDQCGDQAGRDVGVSAGGRDGLVADVENVNVWVADGVRGTASTSGFVFLIEESAFFAEQQFGDLLVQADVLMPLNVIGNE